MIDYPQYVFRVTLYTHADAPEYRILVWQYRRFEEAMSFISERFKGIDLTRLREKVQRGQEYSVGDFRGAFWGAAPSVLFVQGFPKEEGDEYSKTSLPNEWPLVNIRRPGPPIFGKVEFDEYL